MALPAPAGAQTAGLPSVGSNFDATGPYRVTQARDGQNTFYFPADAGEGGVRHPVILWGTGTGANVGSYGGLRNHYASHGFVVAAANTTSAGSGREMLAGLDVLARWNGQSGHPHSGAVDLRNVGATGHSQGAYGAVQAGRAARVSTVFPPPGRQRCGQRALGHLLRRW
jgi:predicted dienelactone hydrolase